MVSPRIEPKACWEFEGEILVLHHPTTISVRYQAMGKLSPFERVFFGLSGQEAARALSLFLIG